jgi:hypothetical protein
MARIVAVHGILQTYASRLQMARAWVDALIGGVENAGERGLLTPEAVECVFYGDVFRTPGRMLGDEDVEAPDADDVDDPAEAELLGEWWAQACLTDPAVVPPEERTLGPGKGVQAALAALAGSRFLAGASEKILLLWLRQVRAYFVDPDVRARVEQRFSESVADDTRVVVAHSLGSVVAYEALHAHPEWVITGLVTLGSPLGTRNLVLDRLSPSPQRRAEGRMTGDWPPSLRSWVNVADHLDFVALVKELRPVFGEALVDVEIRNGGKVHDVTRYLNAAEVGSAIMGALREAG